ncbi:MAG: hypothetical protein KAS32_19365 [Candidatus Peribacteraceae bacterium]|nr:hypothetical protein [Candidatus Peribacteraceae bacterium]
MKTIWEFRVTIERFCLYPDRPEDEREYWFQASLLGSGHEGMGDTPEEAIEELELGYEEATK